MAAPVSKVQTGSPTSTAKTPRLKSRKIERKKRGEDIKSGLSLVLKLDNPNIAEAYRIPVVLHLQGPLVPMLFVFGNGMRSAPAGSTAEFMVVMNHVSVVYDVKLGLSSHLAFVVKNRTMESHA